MSFASVCTSTSAQADTLVSGWTLGRCFALLSDILSAPIFSLCEAGGVCV